MKRSQTGPVDAPAARRQRTGGRSARVLDQVAQGVSDELREVGLAGFSVPRVAQRAGVHTATIYRRWSTVGELLAFVGGRLAARVLPVPDTGSLRGDLRVMLRDVRDYLDDPQAAVLVALAFGAGDMPVVSEMMQIYWRERVEGREALFTRARERGELGPEDDPEELIERAIGPLYVRRYISRRPIDDAFIERTLDGVLAPRTV